jgi:hypothetical protein
VSVHQIRECCLEQGGAQSHDHNDPLVIKLLTRNKVLA